MKVKPKILHIKLTYHICSLPQIWPNCPDSSRLDISSFWNYLFVLVVVVLSRISVPYHLSPHRELDFPTLQPSLLTPLWSWISFTPIVHWLITSMNVVWWKLIYGKVENEINVHKNCEDLRWKMQLYYIAFPLKPNKGSYKHLEASHIFAHHPLFLNLTGC